MVQRATKLEVALVSLDETRPTSRWSVPDEPMFARDRAGRTLFYDSGPRFRGYVVTDVQREWELGNAIPRFKNMQTWLGYFAAPLVTASIFSLGGRYGSFALGVLTVTLVVAAIGRVLQRHWCFANLVVDLDRVEPLDVGGRRIGIILFSLIAAAYCSYVIWRIVQAF